jgi:hypothetical protein
MIKRNKFLEGKSEVQSILFDTSKWTVDSAKEWLKRNKKKFGDVDQKKDYIHFRQSSPGKYKLFRTSTENSNSKLNKQGIKFRYGIKESKEIKEEKGLKSGDSVKVIVNKKTGRTNSGNIYRIDSDGEYLITFDKDNHRFARGFKSELVTKVEQGENNPYDSLYSDEEAKIRYGIKESYELKSTNIVLLNKGMDINGNKIIYFSYPNSGKMSIQTNQNLPQTHKLIDNFDSLSDKDLNIIKNEIVNYIQNYGTQRMKNGLRVYKKESTLSFEVQGMSRVEALRKANQMQKDGIPSIVVYDIKDQDYSVFKKDHYDYLLSAGEISPKDWKTIKEFEIESPEKSDIKLNKIKSSKDKEERPIEIDLNNPEKEFGSKKSISTHYDTSEEEPESNEEENMEPEEQALDSEFGEEKPEKDEFADEELNQKKTYKLKEEPEPLNRSESRHIKEDEKSATRIKKNDIKDYYDKLKLLYVTDVNGKFLDGVKPDFNSLSDDGDAFDNGTYEFNIGKTWYVFKESNDYYNMEEMLIELNSELPFPKNLLNIRQIKDPFTYNVSKLYKFFYKEFIRRFNMLNSYEQNKLNNFAKDLARQNIKESRHIKEEPEPLNRSESKQIREVFNKDVKLNGVNVSDINKAIKNKMAVGIPVKNILNTGWDVRINYVDGGKNFQILVYDKRGMPDIEAEKKSEGDILKDIETCKDWFKNSIYYNKLSYGIESRHIKENKKYIVIMTDKKTGKEISRQIFKSDDAYGDLWSFISDETGEYIDKLQDLSKDTSNGISLFYDNIVYDIIEESRHIKESSPPVKYISNQELKRLNINLDQYPGFGPRGSISGMRNKFYGKDAYLVKNGSYVYNVPKDIYDQIGNYGTLNYSGESKEYVARIQNKNFGLPNGEFGIFDSINLLEKSNNKFNWLDKINKTGGNYKNIIDLWYANPLVLYFPGKEENLNIRFFKESKQIKENVNIDEIVDSYLETALWSEEENPDMKDTNFSIYDFDEESRIEATKDIKEFINKAGNLIKGLDERTIGHNFWLNRNGHGAGFWDLKLGKRGDILSDLASSFGNKYVFPNSEGNTVHIESKQIKESPRQKYMNIFANHIARLSSKFDKSNSEKVNQVNKILDKYLPNHREKGVNKEELTNLGTEDITDLYDELSRVFGIREKRQIKEKQIKEENDYEVGDTVIVGKKRDRSVWLRSSGMRKGAKSKILSKDKLNGKDVYVIATPNKLNNKDFNPEMDYEVVYPDELKKSGETYNDSEIQAWNKAAKELKNI